MTVVLLGLGIVQPAGARFVIVAAIADVAAAVLRLKSPAITTDNASMMLT